MHQHSHCTHPSLLFCTCCACVYCTSCGKEWRDSISTWYPTISPWTCKDPIPYWGTVCTSTSTDIPQPQQTCTHTTKKGG